MAITIAVSLSLKAQINESEEYKKLAQVYAQGKYESCLIKADNFTYKEESSMDAEPYLYVAMCYYQLSISEDPVLREDYKDGYKQALKYTAKFVKKDKEGIYYDKYIEFIDLLKGSLEKEIKVQFEKGEYRKVAVAAKQLDNINKTDDNGLLYFAGMNEILSNNPSVGTQTMDKAKEKLTESLKNKTLSIHPTTKSFLIDGFLKYSEFLVAKQNLKEASDALAFGLKLFPEDGYLKLQYNAINQKLNSNKK